MELWRVLDSHIFDFSHWRRTYTVSYVPGYLPGNGLIILSYLFSHPQFFFF
jgi:hypothetical protein